MAMIEIKNLKKSFGDISVLDDINLKIDNGEFCVLLGSSGSGKSTILKILSSLENFDSGEIKFDDSRLVFDESFSRAVVGVKDAIKFEELAKKYGVEFIKIGLSGGDEFILNDIKMSLKELQNSYFSEFATVIKSED
jgi:ABC-type polar amino acid transport system ATPase subunit